MTEVQGCEPYLRARAAVVNLAAEVDEAEAAWRPRERYHRRGLRADLEWALQDEALTIRLHATARELATALARRGDVQAADALHRAEALEGGVLAIYRLSDESWLRPLPDPVTTRGREAVARGLQDARRALVAARDVGRDFDGAWAEVIARAAPPVAATLASTREAWRAAYEGEPWRGAIHRELETELAPFDPDLLEGARVA